MNKFVKRLNKLSRGSENALVIGTAFGNLENILSNYKTVFVIGDNPPSVKSRNLVYRQNFDHLNQLTEISVIFFDLDKLYLLETQYRDWETDRKSVV